MVELAQRLNVRSFISVPLIARGRTGKGADIRISMFDVMADWMAVPLMPLPRMTIFITFTTQVTKTRKD